MSGDAALRVLTVGDGNLSFSLALHRLHRPSKRERRRHQAGQSTPAMEPPPSASPPLPLPAPLPPLQLTASVFDSEEAQMRRYPECRLIAAELRRRGAELLFNVDATDIGRSLEQERARQRRGEGEDSGGGRGPPFDLLCFHQPHSGREDVAYHRALLSHFFHSAARVAHQQTVVVLTLCNRQPGQWQLEARSAAEGWRVWHRGRWEAEMRRWEALGYENRRHHTGGQFQGNRVSARHRFVLRRREATEASPPLPPTTALLCVRAYGGDDGAGGERGERQWTSEAAEAKEEAEEAEEAAAEEVSEDATSASVGRCPVCWLDSAVVHPAVGGCRVPPVDPSATVLRCPHCRATFLEARALQQHCEAWKDRDDHHLQWREGEGRRSRQSRLLSQGKASEAIEQRRERRRHRKESRRRAGREGGAEVLEGEEGTAESGAASSDSTPPASHTGRGTR